MRRQTLRKTRSELQQSLDEGDRELVMEAWSATERVFTRLRSLSPLTTLLGRAFAAGYADGKRLKGEEAGLTFFMVMFAGYATRTLFLDSIGQPLLDPHAPPLDRLVGREFDYQDPDGNVEAVELLRDPVFHLALSDFGSVMNLSPDLWAGYISLATMQLQANFKSRAVPSRYLDSETVDGMVRYGYVLRCVDEALGAEPDPPGALTRSALARVRWGVLSDQPLRAHSDDELADVLWQGARVEWRRIGRLDEEIDRELFCGMAALFGDSWEQWDEADREFATTSAGAGCFIRFAELELLDEASEYETPEWNALAQVVAKLIDQVLPGPEAIDVAADANRDSGIGAGMAGDIGSDADPGTHAGAGNARPLTETDQVIIRTAHVFASDSNAIQTLLECVPGPSRAVREKTFDRWLVPATAEDMPPTALGHHQLRSLMTYGYAVCVTRELLAHFERKSAASQG